MSHYKPYPAYKDSGVEWLGEVPEHWTATKLKRGFEVCLGKMLQPEIKSAEDTLAPYLRAANIKWEGIDLSDVKEMWFSPAEKNQLSLLKDDLLVSEGGDVGRSAIWQDELNNCYFQNSVNRVRANEKNSTRFLYYWLQCTKDSGYIDILCNKSTIAHFTAEKVESVDMMFPSTSEQSAIASFLDRETAKIDTLISKQEKLIELLKEKRQAVISHAVTKGPNPKAKMKDSGVEWLGEVPEHWDVGAIKYFVLAKNGSIKTGPFGSHLTSSEMQSGSIKVYNQRNVIDGDFDSGENFISEEKFEELSSVETFPGDLLITTRGTIGRAAILPTNAERGILHPCLLRLQPDNSYIDTKFLKTLIQDSDLMKTQLGYLSNATTIEVIYSHTIASVIIPVPPIAEQGAIMQHLDDETAKIDMLVSKSEKAIELQKEHRVALISAAVTGKIDVT